MALLVLSSTGAGRQQAHYPKACQRAHSPTGFPPCHGPGSRPGPCQARSAQGEEGLSVLCLCLSGDCQAVGCCPPHHCPHPQSDTLADTPAGTHYRGECLGKAVRSQPRPGPGCGRWHLRAPYAPCQNWLKEFGEKHREGGSVSLPSVSTEVGVLCPRYLCELWPATCPRPQRTACLGPVPAACVGWCFLDYMGSGVSPSVLPGL